MITWFPFSVEEPGWLLLRYILIAMLLSLIFSRLLVLQQRWRSQTEAEARARLDALQARIRPHFLFNALNAIAELIHEQPDAAEEALLDLSDLLRIGLGTEVRHSLSEELALIRGYLRIEALRLGDKLRVEWLLPERLPDELQLPPLVLQPLVENAVIHGVAARADGGELLIRAQRISFRRLRFEIENPMPGARESADRPGHGTALENIRQRLALAYEERASLKTWEHDGKFHAALTVPLDQ
ncbi:MAG: histidine kinase [Wenzhouxiangella sp.]|nr:histidine kinase [Wenzhouxiangella sp.]MCH8478330.1 histidine kinase [Wenzhouxiangella sp.]